ncbi:MAG: PfkB family carbohydrate kinase, partial [Merdibacter sp.]
GVLCIVDTSGSPFLHVLEEKPFLIKPSLRELEEIFHCPMKEGVLLSSMIALAQRGVRNVLVSCGEHGAYLLDEHGGFYYGKSPAGRVINTAGAGYAMVAGFLKGWLGDFRLCAGLQKRNRRRQRVSVLQRHGRRRGGKEVVCESAYRSDERAGDGKAEKDWEGISVFFRAVDTALDRQMVRKTP